MRHPAWKFRVSIVGLMTFIVVIAFCLASLRLASEPLAGALLSLTFGVLALAILGVVYRQGASRAWWLGFALLGWGYMLLASADWWDRGVNRPELITSMILDRLYPYINPVRDAGVTRPSLASLLGDPDPRNKLLQSKLDMPISMSFPNATPLEHVLKYIKSATQEPAYGGIQIYVDPNGLRRSGTTMTSPVTLDVEGVPLRTTLAIVLNQQGLAYHVRDGILVITDTAVGPDARDAFRRIGHCYWALLAGWMGGIFGRHFHQTRGGAVA